MRSRETGDDGGSGAGEGGSWDPLALLPLTLHPLEDPRVQPLLTFLESVGSSLTIIDVGANSGELTAALARSPSAASVLGVEKDPTLVNRARALVSRIRRDQSSFLTADRPVTEDPGSYFLPSIAYAVRHAWRDDSRAAANAWFADASRSVVETRAAHGFPDNLRFRVGDAGAHGGLVAERGTAHVLLALSVTKWIHVHDGDDGIRTFFGNVRDALRAGGYFVLEPQPALSYTKRHRDGWTDAMRATADALLLTPDDFIPLLTSSYGFRLVTSLSPLVPDTARSNYAERKMFVLQKKEGEEDEKEQERGEEEKMNE